MMESVLFSANCAPINTENIGEEQTSLLRVQISFSADVQGRRVGVHRPDGVVHPLHEWSDRALSRRSNNGFKVRYTRRAPIKEVKESKSYPFRLARL